MEKLQDFMGRIIAVFLLVISCSMSQGFEPINVFLNKAKQCWIFKYFLNSE